MRRSCFSQLWFFPAAIISLVAGNAFDLFGTYVYQPNFEHEANPIYVALQPHGLRLNWPMVIVGKILVCLIFGSGLALFLKRRHRYYPEHPASFRVLLTQFFYGRPLTWFESFYRWPKSLMPATLAILAVSCLGGPYYAYLGYGNLASRYGWWEPGGIWVGRYWLDWCLPVWLTLSIAWFCRELWRDFQLQTKPVPLEDAVS